MGYTNSSLISYTQLSPNHSGQRTHSIDRITPHCVVGQLSAKASVAALPAHQGKPAAIMVLARMDASLFASRKRTVLGALLLMLTTSVLSP